MFGSFSKGNLIKFKYVCSNEVCVLMQALMSFTQSHIICYLGNRIRGEEVGRSWASPPSGSSHTALWCPEAVQEKQSVKQQQFKYSGMRK